MGTEGVIQAIEKQDWLKAAGDELKRVLDSAFERDTAKGKPLENALHGVWLGHPLHPVLTDIPLGAWSVVFVLDVIEAATGTRKFQAGADAALNIGIAGALGAAVTGLTDWKDIDGEARRVGLAHGLLNSAALSLFVTSAVQRAMGKRGAARITSRLAFAIAVCSAWLGGHLVYASQIGVEHKAGIEPPADFVPVLALEELVDSKPHGADCQGYPIVLVRKGAKVYALAATCTHQGGPLSEGTVEGDCIRCPWHGSAFSLETGKVKESPAVRPQVTFEARVQDGQIAVRVRKGSSTAPLSLP